MTLQPELDEMSALLSSQGLTDSRSAADNRLPDLKNLEYSPLGDSEIRLLKILPSWPASNDIQLTLEHFQCDSSYRSTQTYRALSYCWGDASDTVAIIVNDCKLLITKSLEAAIRELKRREYDCIWIDAICINQDDEKERGHQILNMRDIFSNAYETIVWLGVENKHTEEALSVVECLATGKPTDLFQLRTTQLLAHKPEYVKHLSGWKSVAELFALPYWQRTWIIQEIAMSQHTILAWGSHTIAIQTIELVITTLQKYGPTFWFYFTGYENIRCLLKLTRLIKDGRIGQGKARLAPDLLEVLRRSCLSRSREPHDKVFGVLGLAYDGENTIPKPDYREPIDTILRKITITKLTRSYPEQVLDIICLDLGYLPKRGDLPSWFVDWKVLWEAEDGNVWSSRSLRHLSTPTRTRYKACGGSPASVQISSDELILTCRGYIFDVVHGLSQFDPALHEEEFRSEAADEKRETVSTLEKEPSILCNVYGSELELFHAIWLSAVHNMWRSGDVGAVASVASAFQGLFSGSPRWPIWVDETLMGNIKEAGEFKIYGRKLKDWATPLQKSLGTIQTITDQNPKDMDPNELEIWTAIKIGQFCRRMMETSKGFIGTAHPQSQVGDSIVLLQGASVPIILRSCEGGYKVIGEAYVHGIMQGEFWEAQDEAKMENFHLK